MTTDFYAHIIIHRLAFNNRIFTNLMLKWESFGLSAHVLNVNQNTYHCHFYIFCLSHIRKSHCEFSKYATSNFQLVNLQDSADINVFRHTVNTNFKKKILTTRWRQNATYGWKSETLIFTQIINRIWSIGIIFISLF